MRVLVLHSELGPEPPADEKDTLVAARAVAEALGRLGHEASLAAFPRDGKTLDGVLARARADVVFNLVESVDGRSEQTPLAPRLLAARGVAFTGADAAAMAVTNDKPLTKRRLREAGIATPDWSEPPDWHGLREGTWIVKSAIEDASFFLDDASVVTGADVVARHAASCIREHGGRWFAEEFVDGREFNVALLEESSGPEVLPIPEMVFEDWPAGRPRIVGYAAKWDETSFESRKTVRHFGVERNEPALAARLRELSVRTWELFGLSGYARIDFRIDSRGEPVVLEVNTNPGIAPDAGIVAAAAQAGLNYEDLVARIVGAAAAR